MSGAFAGLVASVKSTAAATANYLASYVNYSASSFGKSPVESLANVTYQVVSEPYPTVDIYSTKITVYSYSKSGTLNWAVSHSSALTSTQTIYWISGYSYGDVFELDGKLYVSSLYADGSGGTSGIIARYDATTGALEDSRSFGQNTKDTVPVITISGVKYFAVSDNYSDKSGTYSSLFIVNPLTLSATYKISFPNSLGYGYSPLTYNNYVYFCTYNRIVRFVANSSASFTRDRSITSTYSSFDFGFGPDSRWVDSNGYVYTFNQNSGRLTKIDFSTTTPTAVWTSMLYASNGTQSTFTWGGFKAYCDANNDVVLYISGGQLSGTETSTNYNNLAGAIVKINGADGSIKYTKKIVATATISSTPVTGKIIFKDITKFKAISDTKFLLHGFTQAITGSSTYGDNLALELKNDSSNYSFENTYTRGGVTWKMLVTVTDCVNTTFYVGSSSSTIQNITADVTTLAAGSTIFNTFYTTRTLTPTQYPQMVGYSG